MRNRSRVEWHNGVETTECKTSRQCQRLVIGWEKEAGDSGQRSMSRSDKVHGRRKVGPIRVLDVGENASLYRMKQHALIGVVQFQLVI